MFEAHRGFLDSLDIGSIRVHNSPNFIFLCGGRYSGDDTPIQSARHFLLRHLQENRKDLLARIKLADEINDWFDGDVFPDLLELEEYIANLSAVVVLFVESAGSFAELGAFSLSEVINRKLLVITETKFESHRSFVNLGPVRRVRRVNETYCQSYPWYVSEDDQTLNVAALREIADDLVRDISQAADPPALEEKFDFRKTGHLLLVCADIVSLFTMCTESEIRAALLRLGFEGVEERTKKALFVLQRLGLIARFKYGSSHFYYSRSDTTFVRYGYMAAAKVRDRHRIKSLIRDEYRAEDPRRIRALNAALRAESSGVTSGAVAPTSAAAAT